MPTNLSSAALIRTTAPATSVNPASAYRQSLPGQGPSVPTEASTPEAKQAELKQAELKQAVQAINSYVQSLRRDLQFTVDEVTDRTIIRVIDSETQEVIRQIPSEEVLALARSLERSQGLLLKAQA